MPGDLSADAAIAQSLEAIGAQEKTIGAFVCHDPNARAQSAGPLRGIAVGIKDIMDTADFPTEMGSPIYRGFRPRGDAAVVMMLKQAGATIVGKTTTTAFASRDPTATLNPRNHGHTPGGSSSGSAAAVGGRHDPAGAGDADRRLGDPAGIVLRRGRDQAVLSLAADRRREMLFLDARYRRAVRSRRGRRARGLAAMTGRPELLLPASDSDAAHRHGDAGFCRRAGGSKRGGAAGGNAGCGARRRLPCANLICPRLSPKRGDVHPIVQEFEAHQALAWEYRENYEAMAPLLRAGLDESKGLTPAEYDEAMQYRRTAPEARWQKSSTMSTCLLTLSAPGAAPKGLASTGDARYNRLWTLMGVPCVNVPAIVADGGLPVGVQVIARYGADAGALEAARFVEEALMRQ